MLLETTTCTSAAILLPAASRSTVGDHVSAAMVNTTALPNARARYPGGVLDAAIVNLRRLLFTLVSLQFENVAVELVTLTPRCG